MTTSVRTAKHAEIDADGRWKDRVANVSDPLFHICAIGLPSAMLGFERAALERLAGRVQTFVQRKSPISRHHVRDSAP